MTFCLSYLKTKGVDVISDIKGMTTDEISSYHRNIIKQHYRLVRASELGYFLFRFKSNTDREGPTAFTNEEDFWNIELNQLKA